MTLWRLEVLRLVRTRKALALLGVYGFFAVLGPLTARYLRQIIEALGGGVEVSGVVLPDPVPADGITQFTANAAQLGVLTVVIVAASALALDATPELASFYRTRVARARTLLWPRFVVSTLASVVALTFGTAVAAALTVVLLGTLPWGSLALGTLLGAVYLAFALSTTALVTTFTARVLTAVLWALASLIALPALGLIAQLEPWLPSELVGAVDELIRGASAGDFWRATLVAVVLTAAQLAWAAARLERREV